MGWATRNEAIAGAIAGAAAMATAMGVGRFVLTPILPYMIESLGLNARQAGIIASANFLGYLIGAIAAAGLPAAVNKRKWLLIGLGTSVLTTAAMAMSGSLALLMLFRFAGGVSSAFVLVFATGLVLEVLGRNQRSGLSALHFAGVGTGIAVSALLVAIVVAGAGEWQAQWLGAGALSVAGFAAVYFLMPQGTKGKLPGAELSETKTTTPAIDVSAPEHEGNLSKNGLLPLIISYGLFGFGYVITATFISTMVRAEQEAAWLEIAAWLIVGLAAIPSVLLWSRSAQNIGPMRAYALACLAQGIGVAVSVLASGPAAILIAAVLLGGTFMGITALGIEAARRAAPANPTRAIALMTASFGIGQMVGPTIGGVMADHFGGFTWPSLVAAAALLVAAILAKGFGPADRPR